MCRYAADDVSWEEGGRNSVIDTPGNVYSKQIRAGWEVVLC